MDEITESIIETLENRSSIPLDKTLLLRGLAGLKCDHPTLFEGLAGDGETFIVQVFDVFQDAAAASSEAAAPKNQENPTPSASVAAPSLRSAIEEAQEEVERLADPANVKLPQFEEQGSSWSLTL